jgi:hypothetical protein
MLQNCYEVYNSVGTLIKSACCLTRSRNGARFNFHAISTRKLIKSILRLVLWCVGRGTSSAFVQSSIIYKPVIGGEE